MKFLLFAPLLLAGLAFFGFWPHPRVSPDPKDDTLSNTNPRELGRVRWLRGFENAVREAKEQSKPILILFQEVPGCATCVGYGQQVLSHPLIEEAIQDHFVPLAVYNNISGDDRATLAMFHEPSWNNPVVRIIAADKSPLASRLDGDYTEFGLVRAMVAGLSKAGKEVPSYLNLLAEELTLNSHETEKATFAMSCFWTGEAELGSLPGVLSTKAGFLKGKEVVEVEYDPAALRYEELVRKAHARECATTVFSRTARQQAIAQGIVGNAAELSTASFRPDNEPKYYLSKTLLRHVPMTELQKARINAAIGKGTDFLSLLSPRQLHLLDYIKRHPHAGWSNAIAEVENQRTWRDATALMLE